MDPQQSYVRFTVRSTETTTTNSFNIDNLATCFIKRLDTYHSGNLIDSIQQYNVLMSYLKDAQLNVAESYGLSNLYGTSNSAMMFDDVRIELSLEQNNIAVAYSNASAPTQGWVIQDFQLELQIIELSDEGQSMVESVTPFNQPVYLHGTSWRHYSSTMATGTSGVYSTLVPARFASLKQLAVLPRRAVEVNDWKAYSTSARVNPCFASYWWRVGAYLIPQRFVSLQNTSNTGSCAEGFMELQKAFHGVHRPEMCSGINYSMYNAVDLATADATVANNATTGLPLISSSSAGAASNAYAFAIAQEMESFAQKDGLLLSGMNTLTSQIFFEANCGWGSSNQTNQTTTVLDFYSWFDCIMVLENGILSARF